MSEKMSLWYENPANKWEEALPVGNGRMGAMVTGGVNREVIYLNEDSIWSGGPANRINKDARKYLGEIRRLIREGKIQEAEKLSLMALSGTPNSERSYEPAGELIIDFEGSSEFKKYRRELDLETGIASVSYEAGGCRYNRELLASYPDQIICYHLAADGGKLNFTCRLDRCHHRLDRVWGEGDEIGFEVATGTGIPFAVRLKARVSGGSVDTIGEHLIVKDAAEAELFIDIQTHFYNADWIFAGKENIARVIKRTREELLEAHKTEYLEKFGALSFELGDDKAKERRTKATDKRLSDFRKGKKDPDLFALYFQYGRYLLFSSSRGKCLPANLQGIWNASLTPPWDSKFTININTEMNYWLAESGNLSDCHMPYFQLLRRVCENGKKTAEEMYGCSGSVAHHNTDVFADTAPQDHYIPASFWVMGEAWMATHIWEHYLYTGDKKFLSENIGVMVQCVDFFDDFLIENDKGELVTSPSVSPENVYIMKDGTRGCLCEGATMDIEILMELLGNFLSACKVLEQDKNEANLCEGGVEKLITAKEKATKILDKLPGIKVGKHGQIQEWMEDYDEQEPGHRHISHLYGVYPGNSISYEKTPELMKAAKVTLERRLAHGGGHTGWSRAWIIGLWTHFLEGEKVYKNLEALLSKTTFVNLMDNHPYGAGAVFQIDGNLGASAAMLEMLVQCRDGYVKLLPALPKAFSEGRVSGVCLRGGLELSMEWKDMTVTAFEIKRREGVAFDQDEITVDVNGEKQRLKL
ncbi:glycoside hydrolase family 95 protein [Butyrivibrio sp. VCD2006]|uniref:glycoside hydrolase family 95 protein n=1 Tax=Butyrivibrio sp. VCD2006 TaxID=1280664 RepID=UPI000684BB89|nr:glycoside hydrolase family 95 protein [Butyrivibrio sp. VCD2006]